MENIVLFTGGFDPIHSGHIEVIKQAQTMGRVVLGLNSDEWLARKKGKPFMPFEERKAILDQFKNVLCVIDFDDSDNTAINAINKVKQMFPKNKIIFVNGGDRTEDNIPEMVFDDVEFVFGVGGNHKKNSSSWILKEWKQPTVQRNWGEYSILDKGEGWQAKLLDFEVGKSLSDQRHFERSEHWNIVEGAVKIALEYSNGDIEVKTYYGGESVYIPPNTWHKVTNVGNVPAKVVEVWIGEYLSENDIERRDSQ
jgi:cytidyltransferase-like protein